MSGEYFKGLYITCVALAALVFQLAQPISPALADNQNRPHFRIFGSTFPPFGYPDEKQELQGFSIDLFKAVLAEAGYKPDEQSIWHAPFVRTFKAIENTPNSVGLHIARTPEREAKFVWVGPYYTVTTGLIAQKSRNLIINSQADLSKYRIATITNTSPEQLLGQLEGQTLTIDSSSYPEAALQKLIRGRVDLMAHVHPVTNSLLIKLKQDVNDFEEVYTLRKSDLYFAINKELPEEIRQNLQAALDRLIRDGRWEAVKNRHHLP